MNRKDNIDDNQQSKRKIQTDKIHGSDESVFAKTHKNNRDQTMPAQTNGDMASSNTIVYVKQESEYHSAMRIEDMEFIPCKSLRPIQIPDEYKVKVIDYGDLGLE